MVYKYVQAREVIARVYNDFNVQHSDWEFRAMEWIGQALREMKIYMALVPCHTDVDVISYRAKVPCDLRILKSIENVDYNVPMTFSYADNKHDIDVQSGKYEEQTYVTLNKNGYAHFGFETGTVRFHYKKLPSYYDYEANAELPMVPDNEFVKKALDFYILYRLMGRGYKHHTYRIGGNDPDLNVKKQWEIYSAKATNSVNSLTLQQRKMHSDMWTSMIKNAEAVNNSFFDNNARTTS